MTIAKDRALLKKEGPVALFRLGMQESNTKRFDRLDQKTLDKARARHLTQATLLANGRREYEEMLSRGWTLVQAQGQRVLLGIRQYEMTKKVLGK